MKSPDIWHSRAAVPLERSGQLRDVSAAETTSFISVRFPPATVVTQNSNFPRPTDWPRVVLVYSVGRSTRFCETSDNKLLQSSSHIGYVIYLECCDHWKTSLVIRVLRDPTLRRQDIGSLVVYMQSGFLNDNLMNGTYECRAGGLKWEVTCPNKLNGFRKIAQGPSEIGHPPPPKCHSFIQNKIVLPAP
jgi:hypothetical protein